MLAFDNRGTGLSAKPPGPYTIEELADDAASVLDVARAGARRRLRALDGRLHRADARAAAARARAVARARRHGAGRARPRAAATRDARDLGCPSSGCRARRRSGRTFPTSFSPGWTDEHPRRVRTSGSRRGSILRRPPSAGCAQFEASRALQGLRRRGRADRRARARRPRRARPRHPGLERPTARRPHAARGARRASGPRPRADARSSLPPSPRSSATSSTASDPDYLGHVPVPGSECVPIRADCVGKRRGSAASANSSAVRASRGTPSSKRAAFASSAASSPRTYRP